MKHGRPTYRSAPLVRRLPTRDRDSPNSPSGYVLTVWVPSTVLQAVDTLPGREDLSYSAPSSPLSRLSLKLPCPVLNTPDTQTGVSTFALTYNVNTSDDHLPSFSSQPLAPFSRPVLSPRLVSPNATQKITGESVSPLLLSSHLSISPRRSCDELPKHRVIRPLDHTSYPFSLLTSRGLPPSTSRCCTS